MRKIIFLIGPPGSGKSTLIQNLGWENYTNSMDDLRLILRSPELNKAGELSISQQDNQQVFKLWIKILQDKMSRGEFIVCDAQNIEYPEELIKFAQNNFYKIACVVFKLPVEQIQYQNKSRPLWKQVSAELIQKASEKIQNKKIPWWENSAFQLFEVISSQKEIYPSLTEWVKQPVFDFNHYENIHHIGDLQGCLQVLIGNGGLLQKGFNPKDLYIFTGDLLDRGPENGSLLKWYIEHALPLPNVKLILGNHETHLKLWANKQPSVSQEFELFTQPQLEESQIKPEDVKHLLSSALDYMIYTYREKTVFVNHAGLPIVPENPEYISLHQYTKGTGYWSDHIDQQFENNIVNGKMSETTYQIHGHRNHFFVPINATTHSFNLENEVEYGGHLRWVTLNHQGFMCYSNKNTKISLRKKGGSMEWSTSSKISPETWEKMRKHEQVKEKILFDENSKGYISSFNFTKQAFFTSSWDDVVVKARGFFVNNKTGEIVSRGYDKFFNINEVPDTSLETLKKNLTFPVIGYVKENGFLGNIGYDAEKQSLFVASKSTNSGEFSQWFKDILDKKMTILEQERLTRWLRDNEACMTFEVIDPIHDPHMIAYEKEDIVLLDVFHRSEQMERVDYIKLKTIAEKFHFSVKERGLVFQNASAFEHWYKTTASNLTYTYKQKPIEGFVFEDSQNNMTKMKTAYYSFWKIMRSRKENLWKEYQKYENDMIINNKKREKLNDDRIPFITQNDLNKKIKKYASSISGFHPLAQKFLNWLSEQPVSTWNKSIILLREDFVKNISEQELTELSQLPFFPYKIQENKSNFKGKKP